MTWHNGIEDSFHFYQFIQKYVKYLGREEWYLSLELPVSGATFLNYV
jgi:hypothetical protein